MKRIFEIDPNFRVETRTDHEDAVFYDPRKAPFKIYGLIYENGAFRRMPEETARSVSEGVYYLHTHTAGGRVRFRTDSPYILINAEMSGVDHMCHFPLTGSSGFDLYINGEYESTFMPDAGMRKGYESIAEFGSQIMHDITIHFPLYSNVSKFSIGLADGSEIRPCDDYMDLPPTVYYGSSITQGGCASHPGNAYQNMLTRKLNVDHINLGFSGSAKAEEEMIEYLASLEMSVFVLDYDHNAPTAEHLRNTHEKLFRAVREKHPSLPVIMMSRPKYRLNEDEIIRREIVRTTYFNALNSGDKNVRFIDGPELMATAKNDGTVDGCHPNDLGFFSMATALEPVLKEIYGI